MAIKAIFFDVGGVLSGTHIEKFLTVVADRLSVSAEKLISLRLEHHGEMVTGNSSVEMFVDILKSKFGIPLSKDEILKVWKSAYVECMRLNDELYAWIKSLKGIRIGIISDVYGYHAKINQKRGAYDGFIPCILSCDVHLSKPGKEIFLLALKLSGLKAEECIFIDDKEKNVIAARDLGFNAIVFKDNGQLFADLREAGVKCIP